jgi:acetate kinase
VAGLILTLNAGSSSLKAALFEMGESSPMEIARTNFDSRAGPQAAVFAAMAWLDSGASGREVMAAGHRVVHGGAKFHAPERLTPEVIAELEALVPLAPLHQPECLAAIAAVAEARPGLMQVACFDTAFHWSRPAVAQRLGLPREMFDAGLRRYGFHGLSYQHIVRRLRSIDPGLAGGRVVAAHLGSGASLCAIQAGSSVETTMGFSPLDGLLMSTRCGELDPGAVLYLLQHERRTPDQIEDLLYRRSGLLGVSGLSGDMQALLASADPHAGDAIDLFVHRVALQTAAMAAAMGGLDGVVFTGGIGENSAEIRARVAARLEWLDLSLDERKNAASGERRIDASAKVRAWVIPADEEASIALGVTDLLASDR